MSYLEIRNLDKHYGDNHVLKNFSLSLDQGESLVLLGPSGCGKTTCLRTVAGFDEPDKGTISLNSKTLVDDRSFVPPNKRNMSVVFQNYALWPHMTVENNITYGLRIAKVSKTDIRRKADSILELVQLSGMGRRYINQLSGGQQQRVALARALVNAPDLLLLDEPLSNLDTRLREETRFEIQRIQRELGVSMIYVTHDQEEALSLADRIVVMNQGQIEQIGTPSEIYDRPASRYVASALGPVNVLQGEIAKDTLPGDLAVDVGPHRFQVSDTTMVRSLSAKTQVNLMVRPTSILLRSSFHAAENSNAVIDEALFFGNYIEYKLRLNNVPDSITVRAPRDPFMNSGDAVIVELKSDEVSLATR